MSKSTQSRILCQIIILQHKSSCAGLAMSHDQGVAVCPTSRSALAIQDKGKTLRNLSGLIRIRIVTTVEYNCIIFPVLYNVYINDHVYG